MDGEGITIGQDQTLPYSNQTFEVLGAGWAINRYRELEDVMVRMVVSTTTGALTNVNASLKESKNVIYPSPFNEQLNINLSDNVNNITVYNATGQQVVSINCNGKRNLILDSSNWAAGIYVIQMIEADKISTKKVVKE
jgi:hypothetical protein